MSTYGIKPEGMDLVSTLLEILVGGLMATAITSLPLGSVFQPFLRFWLPTVLHVYTWGPVGLVSTLLEILGEYAKGGRHMPQGEVSTLLEILEPCSDMNSPSTVTQAFQPFLRFWRSMHEPYAPYPSAQSSFNPS